MREIALAQIAVNDGTDAKIFRRLGADDPSDPNAYSLFGGYLDRHKSLADAYENPLNGVARLLREQIPSYTGQGAGLLLGPYKPLEVPKEYSLVDAPVKVHFFEAFIREKVDAEKFHRPAVNLELAFKGVDYLVTTNKELLKRHDVVPMVRFILEQMVIDRHSRLMNGEDF
jgi:hypothetical protein